MRVFDAGTSTPQSVLDAYRARINDHDLDQLTGLIAPDAVFWFSDGTHVGLPAIRRAFEATWQRLQDESYWLDHITWIATGDDAAAATHRFNWRATVDGAPASGSGRGTSVFARRYGRWLIVHEHLSGSATS